MLSLRAEIAACLFAVALLGLLSGWMMQRSRAARRLRRTVTALEKRHATADENARRDIENLEDRLESLGEELRALTADNRALRESSRGGEETLDSARSEAIELSRRQIEAQERLQRIIREREREIAALRSELAGGVAPAAARDVALDSPAAPTDQLDETVRIDPDQSPALRAARTEGVDDRVVRVMDGHDDDDDLPFDDTLESTMDVAFVDAEEATSVLGEETLALVRGLERGRKS